MAKDSAPGKKRTTRTLEPPPVDKLIRPAIVIGLAMLAYQFIRGISSEVSVVFRRLVITAPPFLLLGFPKPRVASVFVAAVELFRF
jgi:hypothetical protein